MDRGDLLREAVPALVRAAGLLARFCDRTEHNEASERSEVIDAGGVLRETSLRLFGGMGLDPVGSYVARLSRVESRYPLADARVLDATGSERTAETWRDLQQVQARHDAAYHPDVIGMPKLEQLRHYTLHVAKLAWLTQEAPSDESLMEDYVRNRLPDLLLFGIKLATVVGMILPDEPITT
jgi:hypothetical protein